jgi:hypothetical protein
MEILVSDVMWTRQAAPQPHQDIDQQRIQHLAVVRKQCT